VSVRLLALYSSVADDKRFATSSLLTLFSFSFSCLYSLQGRALCRVKSQSSHVDKSIKSTGRSQHQKQTGKLVADRRRKDIANCDDMCVCEARVY